MAIIFLHIIGVTVSHTILGIFVSSQPVPSDSLTAAVSKPVDSFHHNVKGFVQAKVSGSHTHGLVLVNLVCVWAITVLCVVHTRYFGQGNVWHTGSKIMSEDTRFVLEQIKQVKDEDVEKRLKVDD